jgi:hypothetical protein
MAAAADAPLRKKSFSQVPRKDFGIFLFSQGENLWDAL